MVLLVMLLGGLSKADVDGGRVLNAERGLRLLASSCLAESGRSVAECGRVAAEFGLLLAESGRVKLYVLRGFGFRFGGEYTSRLGSPALSPSRCWLVL